MVKETQYIVEEIQTMLIIWHCTWLKKCNTLLKEYMHV